MIKCEQCYGEFQPKWVPSAKSTYLSQDQDSNGHKYWTLHGKVLVLCPHCGKLIEQNKTYIINTAQLLEFMANR